MDLQWLGARRHCKNAQRQEEADRSHASLPSESGTRRFQNAKMALMQQNAAKAS
jgi:hypothetical protein